MSDFQFGGRGGGSPDNAQFMEQVKQQIAVANAQELIQKMGNKCFAKCVTDPGSELGSREQRCVSNCVDRYMEAWNIISTAYSQRLQKDREGLH